jgi:predicted RNase H-like HicB family nuclease
MMKKHYPVIIEQDSDGIFIVECPVFKGCRSYGDSLEEALKNIEEAIAACIDEEPPLEVQVTFVGIRDLEVVAP